MDLTLPPLPFFPPCKMGEALRALGVLCLAQDGAQRGLPSLVQEAFLPTVASAVPLPVDVLGIASPLSAPLIPICSATAQIQFRRRMPPASSHTLSLANHSNPPKQRPSNLNKPSDISPAVRTLSRTVPTLASLQPCGFTDLCLTHHHPHSHPCHNAIHSCHRQARRHMSWWI